MHALRRYLPKAGYTIHTTRASFKPFAWLAYVNLHTDGYDESGSAGLHASSQNTDTTFTPLWVSALRQASILALRPVLWYGQHSTQNGLSATLNVKSSQLLAIWEDMPQRWSWLSRRQTYHQRNCVSNCVML